ncbi:hypothetical protein FA743_10760 [Paracoccus gahaiensis]|uniref:Alpha/beta hydrolase n=1 Tax=Paracoccus gahaiensis TaxID=1706839 RepID=A0A4U0RT85_9RHOB|nr:hypothetical protein [Paracoccus gahaiensis]TJZ91574.1 hypothetical protein FA743_10760 [Paracoccus gahaiensis]
MPVVAVNAGEALPETLRHAARALPPGAPIVVMLHGYRYSPRLPAHDPHRHILSPEAGPGGVSWPAALGFTGDPAEGLAVAFGWEARGRLRAAYARAEEAGAGLGALIGDLAALAGRPVGLIGHSLGARVALQALAAAPAGSIGRIVALNAAEFQDVALAALERPAGQMAEILNVTARENDPFDFGLEMLLSAGRRRALGAGLAQPRANWVDLQIDDAATLDALADLGFPTARGRRLMSHWTPYLREGLFEVYRAALCHPWALHLGLLRHHLPTRPQPRWSGLRALPPALPGLRA